MEASRKIEQAFTFYQHRLQNLAQVINQLHALVKNDEVIGNLKDPALQKYRIDRVNEIVIQILNSEKEKMLIRVLEKYEEMNAKLKQKQAQNESRQLKQKDTGLDIERWNYKKQMEDLKAIIIEKDEIILKKSAQIERIKVSLQILRDQLNIAKSHKIQRQEECSKCIKLETSLKQLEQQKSRADDFIAKLKKDGEEAVKMLNEKISLLDIKKVQLQQEIGEKNNVIQLLRGQNDYEKRNEKIEIMKKQIKFLQEELTQVEKQFNIVKDLGLGSTLSQIKKLKNSHRKFKQQCLDEFENFKQDNKELLQKIINKLIRTKLNAQGIRPQNIMTRLNQMENELDFFIENQLVVQ